GFPVSASVLTSGSGGNCSDEYQYRYQASGIWTSWFSYTPGSNISSTGRTAIEIKVIRNCESGSGCFAENVYSWNVSTFTVTSPTMTKIPNLAGVCQGTDVSASIATAGSGGSGCSDNYEYRTNTGSWNSWQTYVPGTTIPTGGVQNIEVRAWRGLCDIGGLCGDSTINVYSWIIQSQPMPPTIDRNPIAINICQSDTVHPTIVSTIGGIGCTNYSQYRLLTGGSWSAWYNYSSGQNILANGRQSVQIRAWKGNCTTGTGCSTSDTIIETWNVTPNITNPSITKIPNRTSVCEEEEVAAALFNPSSGGIGCEDIFEYRLFNGIDWSTWSPYTIGNTISPLGSEIVEIRAYRGNCDPGGNCNNPSPNVISWTVIPSAIPPIITKNPAQNEVCAGTSVSGTITSGSGGISCFDYRQYRFFNGTDWSPWYTYISGSNITTNTPRTKIQVRAFRGCQPTTGCISSDTSMAEWDIIQGVVHPIMTKTPDLSSVCQGATLSANINTSGSGGLGCEDIYEIRLNGGSWQMYIPADPIITDNTVTSVDIRSTRTNCTSGLLCGSPDGNIYSWTVLPQPVAPTLNKIPNEDYVCSGQNVSVNVVAGSGFSCSDYFQYRRYNPSTSLWTNWSFYPTGFQIPTSGYSQVEVIGYNFNCNSQTACNPDTNLVSWNIIPNVIAPTLTKTPNVNTICQGSAVSATIIPGSGGDACSDISEYSVDNGLTWQMYLSGDFINTIGLTNITIRTYRSNCNPLYNCPTSDTNSVQWTVVGLPTSPIITRIPDEDVICQGSSVSASITAGTGGASCNDIYQYRYHTSSGWSTWITYPNNYNISTSSGRTDIVIRAYRSCTGSGCGTSDTSLVSWSIDPSIVNPSIVKTPNNAQVCEGTLLSANIGTAGSGGNGCEDIMEFSADNGLNWSIYIPNDDIQTVGFTKIIVRAYRGNCVGGGACTPTDTNQVTWLIVPAPTNPIIVKNPNLSEICHGNSISATITNGTSGISCSNFSQYRIKSGTTWSAWYNYTSGNNILYPSNANNVEVRAFRGNCGNGCSSSDTVLVNWLIDQTLINPILAKQPNVNSVVEGSSVSASISTTGSQGVGCSDILEFRIRTGAVFSAWTNYIENDFIPTSTYDEIQIRGFRGSCISGDNCPPADTAIYSWMIIQGPQEPTIVRNPNNDVCFGETLYATITPNGGGSSCSEYAQYRTYTGGSWSTWAAYTSGSSIGYPINTTQVEVRAWRGNCDPSSGTLSSDTVIVSWNLIELLTNPTLQKNPNIDTVCANSSVYASILASGTGGFGCSDNLQYRVHNGVSYSVWESYLEGDPINSSSYTEIQIRGIHGMCISGNECPPQDTMIYSWVVIPGPIAPIIAKNPNQANVCFGVPLSATITPGSGGDGCSDTYQYRTYNGTWTAWTAYVSNNTISYSAGTTQVQIRTFRGDCQVGSGCLSSDTNIVSWQLDPSLINPVLSKNPNISSICAGVQVSASIAVSGSGGIGCSDILQYRINDGVNYSAWAMYNEGDGIATNGLTEVQIRGFYGGCISGDECPAQDTLIYIWTITPGPIAPAITRIPSLDNVCRGTSLSASITPGSGGDGCTDSYESRTFNGVWSAWSNYVPSSNINYGTSTQVEIRAYRTDCDPASGCTSSDTVSAIWYTIDNLVNPILTKTPDLTIVCEGTDVSALISTPGSGGEGCNDQLQYRINTGSGFSAWTFYSSGDFINTTSVSEVQIRGFRTNCTSGDQCPPADTLIYSWIISPQPSAPIITRQPNQDFVCRGTNISAEITHGTGGSDCNETYQYRLFDGSWTVWDSYTSLADISYGASVSVIEVRAYRGDCDPSSGCTSSDTNTVSWTIINSLINPTLTKNPDVSSVCSGVVVSAGIQTSGIGGTACSDILQYRIDFGSGFSAWSFYAENDPIPTTGTVTSVQVRGFIGACTSGDECPPMDTAIYTWNVLPGPIAPTITRNPDMNDVCQGEPISADIIAGYGGDDCNETYQYRTYSGLVWSSWTAYSSGDNIPYPIGSEQVEARAYRADCSPLSGCESSDTASVQWNIIELLTNPILEQVPNITTLCQGADVSAIISIPGAGGVGCSDILQYRINDGTYSVWANYVAGDLIPTFGINQVQIRGYRGNRLSGGNCAPTDTLVYEWNFVPQPT
ncbi:MAG: hypothetical protein PHY85_06480, partial [Bacteroidales bacterium]|nr:hypothetical protein [Bacteroidales bacterium]